MASRRRSGRDDVTRDGRGAGAGRGIVRAASRLVPGWRRAQWLAEWEAELAWAGRRSGGGRLAAVRMRWRALASIRDALWLRRRDGRQSMTAVELGQVVRGLMRRPGYAAAVVLTLGLGIGGATTIFSVVDAVLLRPLPYADADRLMQLWHVTPSGFGVPDMRTAQLAGWRDRAELFESVESYDDAGVVVTGVGEPTEEVAALVTAGLFRQLGMAPLRGRFFTEAEVAGAARVALVSEDFWRTRLGGDARVLGRTVVLDDETWQIIGVMPRAFRFPLGARSFWLPLPDRVERGRVGLAVLRPGLSRDSAQARADAIAERLDAETPLPGGWKVQLQPHDDRARRGRDDRPLWILGGAVLALLLIACVNAANLMVVEGVARGRELAVRGALGATRGRIVRFLIAEAAVLSLLAAALGAGIAVLGVRVLEAIAPSTYAVFLVNDFRVDVRVLAFAAGAALVTGLLFGAGPAFVATGGRAPLTGSERAATGSRGLRRARAVLAATELALAMALLVTASLLIRSFSNLMGSDLGVNAQQLSVLTVSAPEHRYPDAETHVDFFTRLTERVRALPGVQGATLAESFPPGAGFSLGVKLEAEGAPAPEEGQPELLPVSAVDDAYFDLLDIPLVAGRAFDARDGATAQPVAVIDVDLARLLWPAVPPRGVPGRRFRTDPEDEWLTVAGVVGDVRLLGLPGTSTGQFCAGSACAYEVYRPISQLRRQWSHEIGIRTAGPVPGLGAAVRQAVRSVDPSAPVTEFSTMEARLREALDQPRFLMRLVTGFTIAALLLAGFGVYAVLAFAVTQRRREFGVRAALGADRRDVVRDVVASGARLALAGIVVGTLVALGATRLLRSLLHEVAPGDPLAIATAALALAAAALAASLLPALRATRVTPVDALRSE
jgi:putative ABC transport system permease protein